MEPEPDPIIEHPSTAKRFASHASLVILMCGVMLFFYLALNSEDSPLISAALFLCGFGQFLYRKLRPKNVQVQIYTVAFAFDLEPADDEAEKRTPPH